MESVHQQTDKEPEKERFYGGFSTGTLGISGYDT